MCPKIFLENEEKKGNNDCTDLLHLECQRLQQIKNQCKYQDTKKTENDIQSCNLQRFVKNCLILERIIPALSQNCSN